MVVTAGAVAELFLLLLLALEEAADRRVLAHAALPRLLARAVLSHANGIDRVGIAVALRAS